MFDFGLNVLSLVIPLPSSLSTPSPYFEGTTIPLILRGANPNSKMGKGNIVNRLEPEGLEFCVWKAGVWFKAAGWYEFITKFSGENYNPNSKMGKGSTVNRLEPEGPEFCDWNVGVWFRAAGWYVLMI